MVSKKRFEICNGVNFNYINTDKFKTGRLSFTMMVPLELTTAPAYTLLPQILTRSCEKYPDFTTLNTRLDTLYGANLYAHARKLGETLLLTVSTSGINDSFSLNGEKIFIKLAELLENLIFHPKFENGVFDEEEINSEKRQLLENIDAQFNDKRSYSINKMIENMCDNEAFGIQYYGTRELVEQINCADIYHAWKALLRCAVIEIIMIGSTPCEEIVKSFKEAFSPIERNPSVCASQIVYSVKAVKEFSDKMDLAQSKLVMGFRTGVAVPDNEAYAMRLAIAVLGGCASSKFFLNIREKQSLCYYCAARYERSKGIMIVDSGVEADNIEKTKQAVLDNIEALANGDLSDYEFDSAKLSMINNFKMMSDTTSDIEAWYITQAGENSNLTPDDVCKRIESLTKQQIVDAAKKIKLDTVYVLRGN